MLKVLSSLLLSANRGSIGVCGVLCEEFHSTGCKLKINERVWTYKTVPKMDEGTDGEAVVDIDYMIDSNTKESMFPTKTSHLRLFNGVPFEQIPVVNIRVTKNNTIINVTGADGKPSLIRSCGIEGFKNAKKGTNVAAQATAISISTKALDQGYKDVRVKVRGLGPGRMASIKGLQMGGLNIISVTDNTRVSWNPLRPRKARRL